MPDQYVLNQDEVLARLGWSKPLTRRIFRNTGIAKRHFALDPTGLSWQELRQANPALGLDLSLKAIEGCLSGTYWRPDQINYLVFCSVTDYNTPHLGYHIAKSLDMKRDLEFTGIEGQGCQSAIPGLKRAYDYLLARQHKSEVPRPVLVVNTEICSTTFFPSDEDDLELVVTGALFADASAAVLVGTDAHDGGDPRHPYIQDFQSLYDPDALGVLGYTWADGRLRCRLDLDVPKIIPRLLAEAVTRLLKRNGLKPGDVRYWAIHPGGPEILSRVEKLLGLSREDTWASWETLREYGNCSSATLVIIAKRVQQAAALSGQNPHGFAVGVTMGAGGSVEACLLRYPT